KMLVLGKHSNSVETLNNDALNVIAFVKDQAHYTYYDDDGNSNDFKKGEYTEISIYIEKQGEDYLINVNNKGNISVNALHFEIIDVSGNIKKKIINLN
ncbi:DUF5110 domain-containing protein, partial [Clostridium sp.]|uniref:DUF5110 domain-containing protein n=1 Tax=Clostridium sp. TaxID=1506 RepID=UPI002FCB61B6